MIVPGVVMACAKRAGRGELAGSTFLCHASMTWTGEWNDRGDVKVEVVNELRSGG